MKRALDVAVSAVALVVLWPLMTAIGILILFTLGSPVLFVQRRPGLGGRPFRLVKFRTMHREGDHAGAPPTDATRLTSVGRLLRSTSLDELPELWNVLRGEMSLVGPRPLLVEYLPLYTPQQARRHEVRPGITGWAQVNGRNAISWPQRFALDVWYVDNQSVWLDLRILAMTVWRVLRREGVTAEGEATMTRFTGV
jgi:sugar transferase EpsL